jgi:hypothetical protein
MSSVSINLADTSQQGRSNAPTEHERYPGPHGRSRIRHRLLTRGDCVRDRLSRERSRQLHDRRQRPGAQWRLDIDGPPQQRLNVMDRTRVRELPVLQGSVVAVAIDAKHRFSKTPRLSIILTTGNGVEGDAHYGEFVRHGYLARRNPRAPNLRQVHLIPSELFDALRNSGFDVGPGDLGENITTAGLELETLPLKRDLHIGASVNIRLTGLRTPASSLIASDRD